jgi:hypothetical protein
MAATERLRAGGRAQVGRAVQGASQAGRAAWCAPPCRVAAAPRCCAPRTRARAARAPPPPPPLRQALARRTGAPLPAARPRAPRRGPASASALLGGDTLAGGGLSDREFWNLRAQMDRDMSQAFDRMDRCAQRGGRGGGRWSRRGAGPAAAKASRPSTAPRPRPPQAPINPTATPAAPSSPHAPPPPRLMDGSFRDMQRMQQQVDAELARAVRELQQQQPGVRVERSEQRGYGSYRWGA